MKTILRLTGAIWVISITAMAQPIQTHIKSGATWKYLATGVSPASQNWKGGGVFDDASWSSGLSPLGYGGDGEATIVPFGPNVGAKYITTYFRHSFSIPDGSGSFQLRYKRDDGIVVYLNGQEIRRENLPAGPITNATLATTVSEQEEPLWKIVDLPTGSIRTGINVIAAEIHQASATSSDIRFDLELTQATNSVKPTRPITDPIATLPILTRQTWNYLDDGTDPGDAWRLPTYDDQRWKKDTTRLGYGEPGDPTSATPPFVSFGSDPAKKFITTYFRKKVWVDNADKYSSFELKVRRDDGIIVYINNKEVFREYMPTSGPITATTLASTIPEAEEPLWKTIVLYPFESGLQTGDNLIAVEVHQASPGSSDMSFDLELRGNTPTIDPSDLNRTVIHQGTAWKYLVTMQAPPANWNSTFSAQFNDTGAPWHSGKSPLGYGGSSETGHGTGTCINECVKPGVTIQNCLTCDTKSITTYFRKTFNLTDVSGVFGLKYQRDDGIVIYINGTEVKREGFPAATLPISYSTLATTLPATEEEAWVPVNLCPGLLRVGENLIAVEIHQSSSGSSDTRFNLELWQTNAPLTLERGPYLQRYSDDSTLVIPAGKRSMTVRWSTNMAALGQVIYKNMITGVRVATSPQCAVPLTFNDGSRTIHEYSVTLTNLEPATPYSYTIQSGTFWQGDATNYFKTAPPLGSTTKTRMWVLGDFGKVPPAGTNADPTQLKVRNAFNTYLKTHATTENDKYIDLWLWLGDNAYGWGLAEQYQRSVFDVYDGRLDAARQDPAQWIMKQTPVFATPGNHDYHSSHNYDNTSYRNDHSKNHYYSVVSNMTSGDAVGKHSRHEEYYSFDHGNIHFVSLDTYGYEKDPTSTTGGSYATVFPPNSPQLKWLNDDLTNAQKNTGIKWIVVFFHHPPYTITEGSHNSDTEQELIDIRQKLVKDVLEKYKVDLVLTGHSHTYQRSWPIQGHYGLEGEFRTGMDAYRVPLAATISSEGRFDCLTSAPTSTTASGGKSLIYRKSSTSSKNYIIYVVNGSGGGTEGNAGAQWPHDAMQGFFFEGGSMYIDVEGSRLDARFINAEGVVRDQFTIIKDADTFTIPLTDGTTHKPDCECTDAAGYTHYVERPPSGKPNLLLSIKKNGNDIGTVGDGTFNLEIKGAAGATQVVRNSPTNYVTDTDWVVINRHWTLKPTRELIGTNTADVRFYYPEFDLWAFRGYKPPFDYNLNFPRKPGVTYLDPSAGGNHLDMKPYKVTNFPADPANGGHTNLPKATSFTGNGLWLYDPNYRPVSATHTSGWVPLSEYVTNYVSFTVGRLSGGGGLAGRQVWSQPPARIGSSLHTLAGELVVTMYPNPTRSGKVYFSPSISYQLLQVTDLQGRVLKRMEQSGTLEELDLSVYPAGTYLLVVHGETGISRFNIVKH